MYTYIAWKLPAINHQVLSGFLLCEWIIVFFPPVGVEMMEAGMGIYGDLVQLIPPPKMEVSPSMGGSPAKDVALMRVNFNISKMDSQRS